jgi:hypothetical protein
MTTATSTHPPSTTARHRWNPLWLLLIMLVGGAVRVGLVLTSDFPLGDGGFFYQSVLDLQANAFVPPVLSSYNLEQLPYVFPPAAFYIVGGLQSVTNAPLTAIFRWYPLVMSLLSILVMYVFTTNIMRQRDEALLATMIFAVLPLAVIPTISGGGVVRATATLCALAAVHYGNLLATHARRTLIVPMGVFLALSLLTQFQWGLFALVSLFVLYFTQERTSKAASLIVIAVLLGLVLAAAWVVYIDRYHTLAPLVNALFNNIDGAPPLTPLFSRLRGFTSEPMLGLLAGLAGMGLFVCAVTKRWLMIVWMAVLLVFPVGLEPLVVPVSLLAAIGVHFLIGVGVSSFRTPSRMNPVTGETVQASDDWPIVVSAIGVVVLIAYTVAGVVQARQVTELLSSLDRSQLRAMAWAKDNTPPESRFIVITGGTLGDEDIVTDWFPTLAGRTNIATTRSSELLNGVDFENRVQNYQQLQACVGQRAVCIEDIVPSAPIPTYVYLSPQVQGRLRAALLQDATYDLVYPITRTRVNATLIFQRLN